MDTTILEQDIEAKEKEIADKQKQINLIKTGIDMDKAMLKILRKGLEKIKEQSRNANS